ncbi:HNH endonuclease [Candidatus Pacearchaeota archaeon]|nr:HNH endonuclease [Candidatus Pacearchaeota archaeon]
MPHKPARPCKNPHCRNTTTRPSGYCLPCENRSKTIKFKPKRERATTDHLYSTRRWRATRELHLSTEPLCRPCKKEGRLVPAVLVDHIKPHKGDEELFWDESNRQSMCDLCHRQKSAREDGVFGNPVKPKGEDDGKGENKNNK